MGLSFDEVAKGWANTIGGIFFCVTGGAKLLCVIDVGSWRLSCWLSKSLLSHWTTCVMAWLNVEKSNKVSIKSFTSPRNPNWNWLMNVASPHEILQANCLNSDACTIIERDPWKRYRILMLDMCSLFKSPKVALNFSRNSSKSLVRVIDAPTKVQTK